SELRRHGTPCAGSCDYSRKTGAESGLRWLDLFRCCLGKTASPGERGSPAKTSRAFESKNEMAARLRGSSRSARCSDTIRTCLRELTIRTIKSLMQMFGAMTRAHRITIGTL